MWCTPPVGLWTWQGLAESADTLARAPWAGGPLLTCICFGHFQGTVVPSAPWPVPTKPHNGIVTRTLPGTHTHALCE